MQLENSILLGDCLEVLKKIPDDTFHAVVTDVPYGLGQKEPTPEEILAFLRGRVLKTGDFMGNDWDIPSVEIWKEVYRVLKPGGHVLSFGGTRTFDLISLGLRMAGFESRDTIADFFPAICWVHGQGMPKSHNISMALDKKAGAKREVLGYESALGQARPISPNWEKNVKVPTGSPMVGGDPEGRLRAVTEPVTPEAKMWDGYGTGLKPSWEPVLVFRKPFPGTVAANVLKHGTGALNIDGCRVRHSSKKDFEEHKTQVEVVKAKGGVRGDSWKNVSDLSGASDVSEAGRWPPNAALVHHPGCRKVGVKKAKGSHDTTGVWGKRGSPEHVYSDWEDDPREKVLGYTDEDGTETVEAWECVEGCPICHLDEQSGNRLSTLTGRADPGGVHAHPGEDKSSKSTFLGEDREHLSRVYADNGGASRFFPQFEGSETSEGRWPPNATLTHTENCKIVGSRKVDAPVINRFDDGAKPFGDGAGHPYTSTQTGDAEGKEEVSIWRCAEGCPVKALDEQSGELKSGGGDKSGARVGNVAFSEMSRGDPRPHEVDSGGASRFFEQFQAPDTPFRYVAKPSKAETSLNGQIVNDHVTKKPVELMRWLVKLVTFKGAHVLDPYCGSGSTLHAAAEEGVLFTGIERDSHAHEIATRRMDIVLGREQERQTQMDAFDIAMGLGDEEDS